MLTYKNKIIKTSVRRLVEFLLRQGDISPGGSFLHADTEVMLEGSRIHRKIQKSQKATYQAEVMLKMEWKTKEYSLVLEGRADGIDRKEDLVYIDEIKGVMRDVTNIEEADPLHLAQAKCYAYLYAQKEALEKTGVQITYCNLETEEIKQLWHEYTFAELENWFHPILEQLMKWAAYYARQKKERKESLSELTFPFEYREGQRQLSALVYRAVQKKQNTFLQAPTGVGKTISTMYPTLKAMGNAETDRIFYLTAKTITRTVAEETLHLLEEQGLKVKAVTITAKEKICPNPVFECDPEVCPMANGHFDRINEAVYALLNEQQSISREMILEYANKHQVCPYELSFEVAAWSDFIICDYNYVFDPTVYRKSLMTDAGLTFLVDEAHNLLDRAREMYSATISIGQFEQMKQSMRGKSKKIQRRLNSCKKILQEWRDAMEDFHAVRTSVDTLYFPLFRLWSELMEYFQDHPLTENREEILEVFFSWRFFLQCMETMDEGYEIYEEINAGDYRVKLFCINPSAQLAERIGQGNTAIFFSATLLPITYYKKLLCDEKAKAYAIDSPFDASNCLRIIANDVTSRYKARGPQTYRKIVQYLEKTLEVQKGNYMVFFPSYEMMEAVYPVIMQSSVSVVADIMVQTNDMTEIQREEFLQNFKPGRKKSLIALCVLGSIYAEGIDLTGERLSGVFIIGTGLPGISYEREVMVQYFDRMQEDGYNYGYRYPGIHKVLQAAGRVIRTAEDIGMVVLMDDRFLWKENLNLLSDDWNFYYQTNITTYDTIMRHFWEERKR